MCLASSVGLLLKMPNTLKHIIVVYADLQASELFEKGPVPITRGHNYKLYKKHSSSTVRAKFSSERIVSVWNIAYRTLLILVRLGLLLSFAPSKLDLSEHLRYC